MATAKPRPKLGRPAASPGEVPTRERILLAAIDLFAAQGYDGTSVRQIAAALGLTESALYRHYSGKKAILEAVLDYAESRIYAPLPVEAGLGSGGGGSVFRGLLEPLPRIMAGSPEVVKIARIMYAEMHHNPEVRRFFRESMLERADEHLAALFDRCVEAGSIRGCDTRSLARVFNSFRSEWAFRNFIMEGEGPADLARVEADLEGSIRFFEALFLPEPGSGPARKRRHA